MIYNPQKEYDEALAKLHAEHATAHLDELVKRSGVDPAQNRKTVAECERCKASLKKLKRKLFWLRFWRVVCCITILLIPVVIWGLNPKIKALRAEIGKLDQRVNALYEQACAQMAPLNRLFTDRDALTLIEKTLPFMKFADCFTAEQEKDMRENYDFSERSGNEECAVDVLAGRYHENPFVFERKRVHRLGTEVYHGYLTIHWTETYRDSKGNMQTRHRTQTLHASVVKPKPYYHTQMLLHYCAQGAPDLTFSREDTHLENKSERAVGRYVKKGERKLKRKADKALRKNEEFTAMANTEFEVLFGATNRSDEVQFRTLFTPLAQTNMVDLILDPNGYQDDFCFYKKRRTNTVVTQHSQGRPLYLLASHYRSHSFDIIKNSFLTHNKTFFRQVFFDFAPLLAIPAYQERPVHSLKPLPDLSRRYSYMECEALANAMPRSLVVHPETRTEAILKSTYLGKNGTADEVSVRAYTYAIAKRLDFVLVLGGDGHMHSVPVPWDEYLPLESERRFLVGKDTGERHTVAASRNGLHIYQ